MIGRSRYMGMRDTVATMSDDESFTRWFLGIFVAFAVLLGSAGLKSAARSV